jgi:hypothetical protein
MRDGFAEEKDRVLCGFSVFVIPAKAGSQNLRLNWVPAFAGMTL